MRVLVVEDDALIARGIVNGLRAFGLTVDHVDSAANAELALRLGHCDALVLDLGLPDEDGMDFLKRLRTGNHPIPVLILTARDAVPERIAGLQAGADDYMSKPFDLGELAARLQALLRRAGGHSTPLLQHGVLQLDPGAGLAWLDQKPVELSRRESSLLAALMNAGGRYLSPEQLKDQMYGMSQEVGSNALNVHIHHLRRKLGNEVIITARGLGYRLGEAAGA